MKSVPWVLVVGLVGVVFAIGVTTAVNLAFQSSEPARVFTDETWYPFGSELYLQGEGFGRFSALTITLHTPPSGCSSTCGLGETWTNITTGAQGEFALNISLPSTLGLFTLIADDGTQSANTSFNVYSCQVVTDKWSYEPNETVIIKGFRYHPSTAVNVSVTLPNDEIILWTVMTDADGNFTTTYFLATKLSGHYLILATDGQCTAAAMFTDPFLFLDQQQGPAGTEVIISGDGFWGDGTGEEGTGIYFGGELVATITATGTFQTSFIVPEGLELGTYTVFAQSRAWLSEVACRLECVEWGWEGCCLIQVGPFCLQWWPACEYVCQDYAYTCEEGWVYYAASIPFEITDENAPDTNATVEGTLGLDNWFISDVSVELIADDDVSNPVVTEYRINASSWTTYDSVFTLTQDGVYLLDFHSIDALGNVEPVESLMIKIDKTAPLITSFTLIPSSGTQGWNNLPVQVYITANDETSSIILLEYSWDNSTWFNYPDPITVVTSGQTQIFARAMDAAGHLSASVEGPLIQIDLEAPSVFMGIDGLLGSGGYYISPAEVTVNGTDGISGIQTLEYSINNGPWIDYVSPLLFSQNGQYNISSRAIDYAGNPSALLNRSFMVDTTPPLTMIYLEGLLGDNDWHISPILVTLAAMDTGSSVDIQYSWDNTTWIPYNDPLVLGDGIITIYYRGTDAAGNQEEPHMQIIQVDTQPPESSYFIVGLSGLGGWYTASISVTLSVEDTLSMVAGLFYSYDNLTWQPYESPLIIQGEGNHTLYYAAEDIAGNQESINCISLPIDSSPPVTQLQIISEEPQNPMGWYRTPVSIVFNTVDVDSGVANIYYRVNDCDWTTYLNPLELGTSGYFTITYYAEDNAGNQETLHTHTIQIDLESPVTNMTLSPEWLSFDTHIFLFPDTIITLLSSDMGSGVNRTMYRINNGSWQNYSMPFSIPTEETNFTLEFYSIDNAGNQETIQAYRFMLGRVFKGYVWSCWQHRLTRIPATLIIAGDQIFLFIGERVLQYTIICSSHRRFTTTYYAKSDSGSLWICIRETPYCTRVIAIGHRFIFTSHSHGQHIPE